MDFKKIKMRASRNSVKRGGGRDLGNDASGHEVGGEYATDSRRVSSSKFLCLIRMSTELR